MFKEPPIEAQLDPSNLLDELRALRFDEYWCACKLKIPAIRYAARRLQSYQLHGLIAPVRPALSASADALDLLIALLLFQCPVETSRIERILSRDALRVLFETNLASKVGSNVQANVLLFPSSGNHIATDGFVHDPQINRVMPLYPESYDLPRLAVKRQGQVALDLCTGSGVAALWISRAVKEVVGVDVNPRALAFGRFNAWLNGISNVMFLKSDLYSAVAGRRFDLITSNTPYNPELATATSSNYHSGGESGEELFSRVVKGLPEQLSPEGFAHIITLMVYREGEDLKSKLRAWLRDRTAMDIAVLARPSNYRPHVLQGGPGLTSIEQALHENWRSQKIERFEFGLINIRHTPPGRTPVFTRDDFRAENQTPPPNLAHLFMETARL